MIYLHLCTTSTFNVFFKDVLFQVYSLHPPPTCNASLCTHPYSPSGALAHTALYVCFSYMCTDCKCYSNAGALALESLHRQVLPFLLRRLKEDVLTDLRPKIVQDYYCELSPLQSQQYTDFARTLRPNRLSPSP